MDGWNTFSFAFGAFRPIFRGEVLLVLGRVNIVPEMMENRRFIGKTHPPSWLVSGSNPHQNQASLVGGFNFNPTEKYAESSNWIMKPQFSGWTKNWSLKPPASSYK